ncbi:MAG: cytochrome C [Ignavibacteriales bacterium]|nr:MAG: cytochrome C [Ignavibacteriales bacterium]
MKNLFFLLLVFSSTVIPQISPGDLSLPHSHLEGLSNCTKCHEIGKQLTINKCLSCHNEINSRIKNNLGYHSDADVKGKHCWKCHSEHNGRNFRIINFNKNKFNHSKVNFELTGSHADLACSKCHNKTFINDSKLKKRKDTYLGLSPSCSGCHEDYHQSTLGNDCSSCHNTNKFRPAVLFNHDKSGFRLTGMHSKVKCEECHPKVRVSGQSFQKFKGNRFNNCVDCHKDIHAGKFGSDCKTCHNTSGFNLINKNSFDHNKTNFRLIGKHIQVECSKCHGKDLNSKPKHENCNDCHKDYHNGEFKTGNRNPDCKDCHSETGFSPSSFTEEKHNNTGFRLVGAHQAIPCKSCHIKNNEWRFRKIGSVCTDCHNNIHGAEITTNIMSNSDCTICHNQTGWSRIDFNHNITKFALVGKHLLADCRDCHSDKTDAGRPAYIFASLKADCENCHKDVHNKQFLQNGITDCGRCHSFDNWSLNNFDHSKTRFPLTGKHSIIECSRCHKKTEKDGKVFTNYKIEDFRCIVCHS